MSPNPNNEERRPSGRLAQLIDETFGSFSNFQQSFENNALNIFGSGYTWLCFDREHQGLKILGTSNQDSPFMMEGRYPIMVIDVWEHAYYLKHQNRRAQYVQGFWKVINWDAVSQLLEFWPKQARHDELWMSLRWLMFYSETSSQALNCFDDYPKMKKLCQQYPTWRTLKGGGGGWRKKGGGTFGGQVPVSPNSGN